MIRSRRAATICLLGWAIAIFMAGLGASPLRAAIFNVRNFGATGLKTDDARPAFQKAMDACAAAGGGTVLVPAGEDTSGTVFLRSHVRLEIAKGATVFASTNPAAYEFGKIASKAALFFGENLEDVALEGAGVMDGQAAYEWRDDDFEEGFDHKEMMQKLGKSLRRSFPVGLPQRVVYPHLVWLGGVKNLRVTGLEFLHSPSWTIALYDCEHARFDGLHIYTSLEEAVWADGLDLDGCRDVTVTNCRIETGDDCVIFISTDVWGPAHPCEDITVTHCRLSSASAGVKFSEGNRAGVRRVRVSDCVLTNVNRGFVFSTTLGGDISDVVLSNLTVDCHRFDWFWSGDGQLLHMRSTKLSEFNQQPPKPGEPAPGTIRNIVIRDVVAHVQGTSRLFGHAERPLNGIDLENIKLFVSADPEAPFDRADHALDIRRAQNVELKNVEVFWDKPGLLAWKSALHLEDVHGLQIDGFSGRSANAGAATLSMENVTDAAIQHSRASEGESAFLQLSGAATRGIRLDDNDLHLARSVVERATNVPPEAVVSERNLPPSLTP